MTITKVTLSTAEKMALKRIFSMRIIIGLIFVFPVLIVCLAIGIKSIVSFSTGYYELTTLLGIILLMGCAYVFFKFALPFYQQTFSNIRASHKIVIETYIIDIKTAFIPGLGLGYTVFTEAGRPLQSFRASLIIEKFGYKDLKVGAKINIHCLENNHTDILYIEPLSRL